MLPPSVRAPVTERIRRAGMVAWAVVGLAVMLALLGWVAWVVRVIWPPLVLAGAIVFILHPLVTALQHRGVPRAAGTALMYLAFFLGIGAVGAVVWPLASDQADGLADEWPEIREDVEDRLNQLARRSEDWPLRIPSVSEIEDDLETGDGDESIQETIGRVRDVGGRVFHVALIVLLAPILAFYLLVDLPRLRVVAESLIPRDSRDEVLHVGRRLSRAIGGFFRGQLLVALIVGVMVSVGLGAIRLPFWLLIGMIAGIANIVPLIGPWVGGVPGVVIALTTRDPITALWVVLIMAGAQQVDNHFVSPLVMQRAVRLHPAAVLLALLAGGTLGGFFGLLVAVPAAAVLKILVGHLWRTYVLGEDFGEAAAAEEADEASEAGLVRDVVSGDEVGAGEGDAQPASRR
jgi:predicted PurR-regulated permease PerM